MVGELVFKLDEVRRASPLSLERETIFGVFCFSSTWAFARREERRRKNRHEWAEGEIGQNNHLRCPDRFDTICHNSECATFEVHGSKVTKEKKLGSPKLGESEKRFSSLFGPI